MKECCSLSRPDDLAIGSTPVHIIMDCPSMSEHRNQLWDSIIDILDVEASVDLFHLDDVAILAAMLGGT